MSTHHSCYYTKAHTEAHSKTKTYSKIKTIRKSKAFTKWSKFKSFVAFCSFFLSSLTVFHRGRQLESVGRHCPWGRQLKSSRAGQQYCFPYGSTTKRQQKSCRAGHQNNFFIFWSPFSIKISPENASKHPIG